MDNIIFTLLICFSLVSCGAVRTFHDYARGGDTVAVPVGMQPTFTKDNITVTITPGTGAPIVLPAADPAIRAVINLYPDPVSNMIVSREIQESTSPSAYNYSDTTLLFANYDKDYFQTTVFVDMPVGISVGLAQINISDSTGATHDAALDIIAGVGTPNTFRADIPGAPSSFEIDDIMRDTLARAPHTEVSFTSATIPHAIELSFSHDPDRDAGGTGKAFVINPLGYIKTLSWNDDGTNLKIIMLQSSDGIIGDMNDYKFYIAGTVTNLQLVSTNGYDINGDYVLNITPTLTVRN